MFCNCFPFKPYFIQYIEDNINDIFCIKKEFIELEENNKPNFVFDGRYLIKKYYMDCSINNYIFYYIIFDYKDDEYTYKIMESLDEDNSFYISREVYKTRDNTKALIPGIPYSEKYYNSSPDYVKNVQDFSLGNKKSITIIYTKEEFLKQKENILYSKLFKK